MLEVADRGKRLRLRRRRVRVERILLVLDRAALSDVRPAGEALRDEALYARGLGCAEQVVGSSRAQLVGAREVPVEVPEVAHVRERRHLVDDDVRFRPSDRLAHLERVQSIEQDRLGSERPQARGLVGAACGGDDVVSVCGELRHEPLPDRTCRAGE